MKVKVCGMREAANMEQIAALNPDFMGFIFFDKSPRYVGDDFDADLVKRLPRKIQKVGVFVNASIDTVLRNVKKYELDYIQLHGNETPDYCRSLRMRGVSIIKAFSVNDTFNFSMLNNYKPHCDFFLFDAKGEQPGGNGIQFDWRVLSRYDNEKPFFLSGGIGADNLDELENLRGMKLYGIDVNSKIETEPGLKSPEALKEIMIRLKPVEEEVS
jgi:phosphoribosylanthranilate isomerase